MDKSAVLLVRLLERTRAGSLAWEPVAEPDVFLAPFPSYAVSISTRESHNSQEPDYVISITDPEGTVIEEFGDVDVKSEDLGGKNAYTLMRELHTTARRIALGVEQAYDDIISHLNDSDPDAPF